MQFFFYKVNQYSKKQGKFDANYFVWRIHLAFSSGNEIVKFVVNKNSEEFFFSKEIDLCNPVATRRVENKPELLKNGFEIQ